MKPAPHQQNKNYINFSPMTGMTLIELLVTITILAIFAAIAIPSFIDMIDRSRVVGASDSALADFRYAQAEAMKSNKSVEITATEGSSWCFGIGYLGDNCDCSNGSGCLLHRTSSQSKGIASLTANAASDKFTFNPRRNSANSGNFEFQSKNGKQIRVVVNSVMRIWVCSPAGSGKVTSYPDCS